MGGITLGEYEARALTAALNRVNESSIRWLPDYMDRLERDIEEFRLLVERAEMVVFNLSTLKQTKPVEN